MKHQTSKPIRPLSQRLFAELLKKRIEVNVEDSTCFVRRGGDRLEVVCWCKSSGADVFENSSVHLRRWKRKPSVKTLVRFIECWIAIKDADSS